MTVARSLSIAHDRLATQNRTLTPDVDISRNYDGATRTEVRALQRHLNGLQPETNLKVDGYYGPKTQAALKTARRAASPEPAHLVDLKLTVQARDVTAVRLPDRAKRRPDRLLSNHLKSNLHAQFEDLPPDRATLLARDYDSATPKQVGELQTFLTDKGYELGRVDKIFGPKTKAALQSARDRDALLAEYQSTNSAQADALRVLSPLPKNITTMMADVVGLSTATTNSSFSKAEERAVFDAVNNAMDRTGELSGATAYEDYGERYVEFFERGNLPAKDIAIRSMTDPKMAAASILGRSTYMVDPEDPDKIYVVDRYDWSKGDHKKGGPSVIGTAWDNVSEGDWKNLGPDTYKSLLNWFRGREESTAEKRTFLVLSRSEFES